MAAPAPSGILHASMRGTFKRGIALCALVGALGAGLLFGAAPAAANLTQCDKAFYPHFSSVTWHSLTHQHLSCEHAKERAAQVYSHGRTHGYDCTRDISGRRTSIHCTSQADSHKQFSAIWYVK
jgi:hypothetical protein